MNPAKSSLQMWDSRLRLFHSRRALGFINYDAEAMDQDLERAKRLVAR